MTTLRVPTDLYCEGTITAKQNVPSIGTVSDSTVQANAGISANKLKHQYQHVYTQGNIDAIADQKVIHVVHGLTGTLETFKVGLITPPDTASGSDGRTAIVDLLLNGSSILTEAVTLDSTSVPRALIDGVLSSSTVAAGDVLEVVVTLGAGTVGTHAIGVFATLKIREDAD